MMFYPVGGLRPTTCNMWDVKSELESFIPSIVPTFWIENVALVSVKIVIYGRHIEIGHISKIFGSVKAQRVLK